MATVPQQFSDSSSATLLSHYCTATVISQQKMSRKQKQAAGLLTNARKNFGACIVLSKHFVEHKIEPEIVVAATEFWHKELCQYALQCIQDYGNNKLFAQVRDCYCPRLLRFFWQTVELRDNHKLYFTFGDINARAMSALLWPPRVTLWSSPRDAPKPVRLPSEICLILWRFPGSLPMVVSVHATLFCGTPSSTRSLCFLM